VGKGEGVDGVIPASAGVKPHGTLAAWLRKLDRSGALPESIFEHCVSPSPPDKRLQGNRWVGWVRMATAPTDAMHPSQVAGGYPVHPLPKKENERAWKEP